MTAISLDRLIFTTSRLAEFCSEKELINQTGHDSDDWPLVILKELVDNGLDACECSILDARARFLQIAQDYTWANPHLSLLVKWGRAGSDPFWETISSTDPTWLKWRPSDPTSPHWYDAARLARLIGACISHDEDHGLPGRTVRAFVSEFRGLSGSAKARDICESVGVPRMSLAEFYGDGEGARIAGLLDEMRNQSGPIKPRDLGIIGEAALRAKFESAGAAPESFSYKRAEVEHDGVPYLVEGAFGYCPDGAEERRIITGINWSVAIRGDPFRHLGPYEESLGAILTQRAGPQEPIVAVLHLARPRVEYLDRGKSSVSLPLAATNAIVDLIEGMTSKWAKQRKAEERAMSARARRNERLIRYDRPTSIKDAAYYVMEKAYLAASANGTLPANPRQIMYAARPEILTITGKDYLDDQYFTQTLLPDYIRLHRSKCAGWDIAWDDRGHFVEPHTGKAFGIGTLNVRDYIASYASPSFEEAGFADAVVKTSGPKGRYGALLYIEKEGFLPLLERARLAEKFDIAITSCKGMSVTAARQLVDRTCARYGIPLLLLHDFDISGFSIAKTLCSDTRRCSFKSEFETIDLGLRLTDVQELGLVSEPVSFGNASEDKIRDRLEHNGATEAEIDFIMEGQRVELNAMASDEFVEFVESKLIEAGIAKIVPPKAQLADAYRLFTRSSLIKETVTKAIAALDSGAEIAVPEDIEARVCAYMDEHPDAPWEDAVRDAVDNAP